jgi:hypothetical protein
VRDQTPDDKTTYVTYRSGTKPPAVLIHVDRQGDLVALKELLLSVANAAPPTGFELAYVPWIELRELKRFYLQAVEARTAPRIRVLTEDSDPPSLLWLGDMEEWVSRALLVEGLLTAVAPSFQYLTGYEGIDDIDVEVSWGGEAH